MNKFLVFLLISLMAFNACGDSEKRNDGKDASQTDTLSSCDKDVTRQDPLVFDLEQSIGASSADTFVLNTITDSVRFVPLETNGKSIIENFNYVFAAIADEFLISGGIGNYGKGVLQFDSRGSFIGEIARIGRGPGELRIVMSWSVNESLRKICVMGQSRMVVKWLDTGNTYDISIKDAYGFDIVPLDDGSCVFTKTTGMGKYGVDIPYLTFLDSTGSVIHSLNYSYNRNVDYDASEGRQGKLPFEKYNISASYMGGAIFQDVYNDTLFYIKDRNHITPYIVLKRGKLMSDIKDVYDDARKAQQVYFRNMTETEKYFLIKYFYRNMLYTDIWDKSSKKLISRVEMPNSFSALTQKFNARYELPNGEETIVNIVYAKKDQLYCLLEAPVAAKFMDNIDEEDNPVVMILHLK